MPQAGQRLFYLSRQPIRRVLSVQVDGGQLDPSEYAVGREHGWITVGVTPAVELEVDYLFSRSLDMAVANWGSSEGNHVYYNRLLVNGNADGDGDVDLNDYSAFQDCMTGPAIRPYDPGCEPFDFDADADVDERDFAAFQLAFTGSL